MRWSDLVREQPMLADLGARRLLDPGVVLVVTIRRDGAARLSPVEPLLWDGDLWLSMGLGSRKAADLRRDPRILVHSIVTDRSGTTGEYKVRGSADPVTDAAREAEYANEVVRRLDWQPEPGRFHLFRVEVEDVTYIRWDDATNDQYVTRWPTGEEYVRRGTSATSQGQPEPRSELLRR